MSWLVTSPTPLTVPPALRYFPQTAFDGHSAKPKGGFSVLILVNLSVTLRTVDYLLCENFPLSGFFPDVSFYFKACCSLFSAGTPSFQLLNFAMSNKYLKFNIPKTKLLIFPGKLLLHTIFLISIHRKQFIPCTKILGDISDYSPLFHFAAK